MIKMIHITEIEQINFLIFPYYDCLYKLGTGMFLFPLRLLIDVFFITNIFAGQYDCSHDSYIFIINIKY